MVVGDPAPAIHQFFMHQRNLSRRDRQNSAGRFLSRREELRATWGGAPLSRSIPQVGYACARRKRAVGSKGKQLERTGMVNDSDFRRIRASGPSRDKSGNPYPRKWRDGLVRCCSAFAHPPCRIRRARSSWRNPKRIRGYKAVRWKRVRIPFPVCR